MRLSVRQTVTYVLAQAPSGDPGGQGEDFGKSSPVGLVLLILFGIAVVFLVRSMSKHLKKLPNTFDEQRAAAAAPRRVKLAESKASADSATSVEESGETESSAEREDRAEGTEDEGRPQQER